jgi:hypothetical protein
VLELCEFTFAGQDVFHLCPMARFENESRNNFSLKEKAAPLMRFVSQIDERERVDEVEKALFVLNEIGEIIFQAVHQSNHLELIGTILLEENGKTNLVSEIYLQDRKVLVIRNVGTPFPSELIYQWLDLVLFPKVKQFFLIDGIRISQYNSMRGSKLRVLLNEAVPNQESIKYSTLQTLETGNILEHSAAALICHCELNSLPVILCVAIREASYTHDAAHSFLAIASQLSEFLEVDQLQFPDSNSLHQRMVKRDPFLSRTSNMFI